MEENLKIYSMVKEVPDEARKQITGGRLAGMTDIKPMWRIEKLTEVFGPVGLGWYTTTRNKEIIEGANGEKIAVVDINLFVNYRKPLNLEKDSWSEAIEGTGGNSFIAKEKNGLYTSDECFKMAYTDALSVACKSLGMGADIYWGDSKYARGETVETVEEAKNYVLKFGKNKGKKLSEVPKDYITWLYNNDGTSDVIKKAIELLNQDNGKSVQNVENQTELVQQVETNYKKQLLDELRKEGINVNEYAKEHNLSAKTTQEEAQELLNKLTERGEI